MASPCRRINVAWTMGQSDAYKTLIPNRKSLKRKQSVVKYRRRRSNQKILKSEKQKLKYYAPKFGALSELTNASSGLTFGPILRGDAEEAKREIIRLFSARGNSKWGTVQEISENNGRRVLKVSKLEVYGTKAY